MESVEWAGCGVAVGVMSRGGWARRSGAVFRWRDSAEGERTGEIPVEESENSSSAESAEPVLNTSEPRSDMAFRVPMGASSLDIDGSFVSSFRSNASMRGRTGFTGTQTIESLFFLCLSSPTGVESCAAAGDASGGTIGVAGITLNVGGGPESLRAMDGAASNVMDTRPPAACPSTGVFGSDASRNASDAGSGKGVESAIIGASLSSHDSPSNPSSNCAGSNVDARCGFGGSFLVSSGTLSSPSRIVKENGVGFLGNWSA